MVKDAYKSNDIKTLAKNLIKNTMKFTYVATTNSVLSIEDTQDETVEESSVTSNADAQDVPQTVYESDPEE